MAAPDQWGAQTILINPFRFCGYYSDFESAMCYCLARCYSPEMMSFEVRDSYPVHNRYAYCENNPVEYSDPTGHMFCSVSSQTGRRIVNQQVTSVYSFLKLDEAQVRFLETLSSEGVESNGFRKIGEGGCADIYEHEMLPKLCVKV